MAEIGLYISLEEEELYPLSGCHYTRMKCFSYGEELGGPDISAALGKSLHGLSTEPAPRLQSFYLFTLSLLIKFEAVYYEGKRFPTQFLP